MGPSPALPSGDRVTASPPGQQRGDVDISVTSGVVALDSHPHSSATTPPDSLQPLICSRFCKAVFH